MNARPQDVLPSALDNLRAHRAAVARLQETLAQYNAVTGERNARGGTVAHAEVAISTAKSERWVDSQEVARLSITLDVARASAEKFERRHRDDFAHAERLQRELGALGSQGMSLTAAALLDHAMTSGVEAFADSAELWIAGYVEWAAAWRACQLAGGNTDPGVPGIPLAVKLSVPVNAPKSAALDALRSPRDLTQRIEQRARELLAEIQAA